MAATTRSIGARAIRTVAGVAIAVLCLAGGLTTPAVAADLSAPNTAVQAAFDMLSSSADTSDLVDTLGSTGVAVRFAPMSPRIYARYSVARKTIEIDSQWQDSDPVTLAAMIAHEAVHAQDAMSGYLASGGAVACVDSEVRAFRRSAHFWIGYYGPHGKPDASNEVDRQLNLIAQREQSDPSGLEQLIRQAYTDQCGTT